MSSSVQSASKETRVIASSTLLGSVGHSCRQYQVGGRDGNICGRAPTTSAFCRRDTAGILDGRDVSPTGSLDPRPQGRA